MAGKRTRPLLRASYRAKGARRGTPRGHSPPGCRGGVTEGGPLGGACYGKGGPGGGPAGGISQGGCREELSGGLGTTATPPRKEPAKRGASVFSTSVRQTSPLAAARNRRSMAAP